MKFKSKWNVSVVADAAAPRGPGRRGALIRNIEMTREGRDYLLNGLRELSGIQLVPERRGAFSSSASFQGCPQHSRTALQEGHHRSMTSSTAISGSAWNARAESTVPHGPQGSAVTADERATSDRRLRRRNGRVVSGDRLIDGGVAIAGASSSGLARIGHCRTPRGHRCAWSLGPAGVIDRTSTFAIRD